MDLISHFTLRLAFCQSEELRRWYLQWETELFRFRLERESPEERLAFQEDWHLTFDAVDVNEKNSVINSVAAARPQVAVQVSCAVARFGGPIVCRENCDDHLEKGADFARLCVERRVLFNPFKYFNSLLTLGLFTKCTSLWYLIWWQNGECTCRRVWPTYYPKIQKV